LGGRRLILEKKSVDDMIDWKGKCFPLPGAGKEKNCKKISIELTQWKQWIFDDREIMTGEKRNGFIH